MPDNSVDAIVTDPPYELGFMGKGWDKSGIANSVEMWREALRVLKPGGHLLAFSGSRTYHRMTCAIEDAGFEVRDQIMWLYGSGFPKSLDVSKAIDKVNGEVGRLHKFTAWMRTTGLTGKQINDVTGTFMGSHYLTDKSQPAIPTPELWAKLRRLCGDVPTWVDDLVERIAAEREVIGQRTTGLGTGGGAVPIMGDGTRDITAPATEAARQWQGWGTALKPAHEPICVARKPLIGNVAENVLAHGTGAINVDGCRVGDDVITTIGSAKKGTTAFGDYAGMTPKYHVGRWPANVIHDGSDEVLAAFPQAKGQQGALTGAEPSSKTANAFGEFAGRAPSEPRGDAGSAARFFYCAKASKSDRGDGNTHPTVKPTELMRYLCRLVTPPGGVVLDPFMGSGSTGKACMREGFRFVGIDMTAEYVVIARARIGYAAGADLC